MKGADLPNRIFGYPAKALLIIKRATPRKAELTAKGLSSISRMVQGYNQEKIQVGQDEVLRVQYNPSTLSMRANAKTIKESVPKKAGGNTQKQRRGPSMSLSLELLFDEMNVKDSFMFEKARLSAGDVVSDVRAMAQKFTVTPQINGVMALLMDAGVDGVIFAWQDLMFEGQVTSVHGEYTMFSVSGTPVRGKINLTISQSLDSGSNEYWQEAYDRCFSGKSAAGGKNFMEKGSSLININL